MKHLALFFLADSVVNLAHHGASMHDAFSHHRIMDGALHMIGIFFGAGMFAWAANKIIARLKDEP